MGCVQSRVKPFRTSGPSDEEVEAARLLAHQQVFAAKKAAAANHRNVAQPPPPPPPETEVMKRATAFDKLHADALRAPSLQDVKVVMGKQSQKLLEGFEQKEAAARAVPKLHDVKTTNVRNSKLFEKLQQYEENDARVRQEPKLEKSFTQREKEKSETKPGELSPLPSATQSMSDMTTVPKLVPSV